MSLFVKDESAICCLKCDLIKQVSPLVKNQNVRSIVTDKVNNEGNLNSHPGLTIVSAQRPCAFR